MTLRRVVALALLLMPVPLAAQYQPPAMSDADALADQMRRLGANATDLDALLTAGELSIRLDDLSAAGAFFARAEKIDPRSGRAKAGEGAILVRSERPGEALRYFTQAEQLGLPVARFASDRGLAYDLLGDPGRAQRDYKLALAARDDSETRRRYALSLGIAGRQAQALDELAPLIRQNDRAAWRSRAFVLAMGGDAAAASRIAQTMMPPGAATGLAGFFTELPRLPVVDRAFAVHFGEVRPTPQRLADARIAPVQTPLALDPLPVQVAAVTPPPGKRDRKRDKRKGAEVAVLLPAPSPVVALMPSPPAYQTPSYVPLATTTPVRDRPLTAGEQASLAAAGGRGSTSYPARSSRSGLGAPVAVRGLTAAEQANLTAAGGRTPAPPLVLASVLPTLRAQPLVPRAAPPPVFASTTRSSQPLAATTSVGSSATTVAPRAVTAPMRPDPVVVANGAATPAMTPVPASAALSAQVGTAPTLTTVLPPSSGTLPGAVTDARPLAGADPGFSTSPTSPQTIGGLPSPPTGAVPPIAVATALPSLPGAQAAPVAVLTSSAGATPASGEMASAVTSPPAGDPANAPAPPSNTLANVSVPALTRSIEPRVAAVVPTPSTLVTPAPVPRPTMHRPRPARGGADTILAKIVSGLTIPAAELEVDARVASGEGRPLTAAGRRAAGRQALADKALADKAPAKPVEDKKAIAAARKALADKKAAAAEKTLADKEAAEAKRAERAQPARIWVQVAGGANEAGLNIAWRTVKGKAPTAFGARQAYTTPLRATNRVLTGPFKTDAEARAYVNQLAKAGVPAFTFTSDKGQKITKLDAK